MAYVCKSQGSRYFQRHTGGGTGSHPMRCSHRTRTFFRDEFLFPGHITSHVLLGSSSRADWQVRIETKENVRYDYSTACAPGWNISHYAYWTSATEAPATCC
ncbi:uncharacterized protein LOC118513456 [Anopheles stephensi]|uniref:uncharacterized protein LOC118513456 n=1 Tax=Anopheles stephensi TaxID=30069 RepID=UPI0016587471|nr:uncharacterized protein LOC118513456 [Anopheles stephensi]